MVQFIQLKLFLAMYFLVLSSYKQAIPLPCVMALVDGAISYVVIEWFRVTLPWQSTVWLREKDPIMRHADSDCMEMYLWLYNNVFNFDVFMWLLNVLLCALCVYSSNKEVTIILYIHTYHINGFYGVVILMGEGFNLGNRTSLLFHTPSPMRWWYFCDPLWENATIS